MKVHAIRCKKCGDTIYSRAQHDFRRCSCQAIAIDGGFTDWERMLGTPEDYDELELEVPATKVELHEDWNQKLDKFGIVPSRT